MFDRPDLIYLHDGSFAGFLCCVFESFVRREAPLDIVCREDCQTGLYAVREIESDRERAGRVFRSIGERMGVGARQLVQRAFLFGEGGRDLWLYRFLCRGYRYGPAVCDMLGDEAVSRVQKMALSVSNEAHLLLGFVRFAEYDGALLSQISPKHFVLPVLREHFCDRYPEETFMIHDKSHQMALIYRPHQAKIVSVGALKLPPDTPQEQLYRQLWRGYHQSATIAARVNPRCQRGNMPKRFWGEMCEMAEGPAAPLQGGSAAGLQKPEQRGKYPFALQKEPPHHLVGE
ncbi:TIGR03915 family putative DNA repair protein [Bittarella massiliensis (ex Durand et al. 2017)]|uniref:TIGR03915 family putative DNA repair protein n=1 Tax=Bittarella massiliensis (ex Durand et al. 2017) TaxID=1720313 RepID=UPI001AA1CAD5|nr:TIGR03915 family putative DNA repair protein [Bittarella massiliensis (ex Durand et al. 2017)]MBO1678228.1 DNA metabolism protein [Bittarella massiliensis (ex Durand et al. 2017)]